MKEMGAVELCRMRRTHSIVDDFVERNRKQFSSCTKLGVKISITTKKDTTTVKIRDGERIRKTVNLLSLDFDRQFSGVAIKKFKIELSEERSYEMSWKLFHIMQKFRPVCENLNIRHFENDILCKMLEFITVRETAMIVPKDHMNNNQLFDKYIAKLSKMQMSHKMSIQGTFISDVDGLFEKVKYFGEFGFHVQDVEMFRTFFYDMYESSNLGNLKRICCNFVYWKNDIESPISFKNTPPSDDSFCPACFCAKTGYWQQICASH